MMLKDLPKGSKIYFVGIGGISMSSLAHILLERGYAVAGYDRQPSELTEMLKSLGAEVYYDTDASHLSGVSAAVFSAAFGEEHPEIINIRQTSIPLYSRAQLLGAIAKEFKCSIGVAGTHGKSSTTAMIYSMLCCGGDPTVLDGAVITKLGSQYKIGSGDNMVFESCEYKDSFLSFFPHIAVVLNVSLDHTDYFHSIEQMRDSFTQFMNNTGKDGYAVVNIDSEDAKSASNGYKGKLVTFSPSGNKQADCYLTHSEFYKGRATDFGVYCLGRQIDNLSLSVVGVHSVANSLAAIACGVICGLTDEQIRQGLASYSGISRRFEYKGTYKGADVYSDYAHHPDEIKTTLHTAKYLGGRVVTVFQPHTYSRLHDLFDGFCDSFGESDVTIFAETYSARETNVYGISPADMCPRVKNSVYLPTFEQIKQHLDNILQPGDTLIIMGAGNIDELSKIAIK